MPLESYLWSMDEIDDSIEMDILGTGSPEIDLWGEFRPRLDELREAYSKSKEYGRSLQKHLIYVLERIQDIEHRGKNRAEVHKTIDSLFAAISDIIRSSMVHLYGKKDAYHVPDIEKDMTITDINYSKIIK